MKRNELKKKLLVLTLACTMAVAGCGSDAVEESKESSVEATTEVASTEEKTEETAEAPEESKVVEKQEVVLDPDRFGERTPVFDILNDMTVGWNLGNSLDAHGTGNTLKSETYWGNPKTTQKMVDEIKNEGFNVIRVPVTFAEHVGPAPEYTIEPEWLDRVQEVVDYGMNAGMYVILDTHHEPDHWLIPNAANEKRCVSELSAIWHQVAERFADYDKHLIFEGMNEPRVKGTDAEWSGGTLEERGVVDHLNKVFVDTVREVGGNNSDRMLLIATYGNSCNFTLLNTLEIPNDNNICIAVHLYTPYAFTYTPQSGNVDVWDGSLKSEIETVMKYINTFVAINKVPVMITEFGAVHHTYKNAEGKRVDNEQDVIAWMEDYFEIINRYGLKAVWWDNNVYNEAGEKFGIFDRRNCTWFNKNLPDKLVELASQCKPR